MLGVEEWKKEGKEWKLNSKPGDQWVQQEQRTEGPWERGFQMDEWKKKEQAAEMDKVFATVVEHL